MKYTWQNTTRRLSDTRRKDVDSVLHEGVERFKVRTVRLVEGPVKHLAEDGSEGGLVQLHNDLQERRGDIAFHLEAI